MKAFRRTPPNFHQKAGPGALFLRCQGAVDVASGRLNILAESH